MRKRFTRLRSILQKLGLGEDAFRHDVESRREVQAALFLLQLLQQKRSRGMTDLSAQSGYFFKWYAGPYSSRLDETHGKLVNHLHYENPSNGHHDEEFSDSPLVILADEIGEDIHAPSGEGEVANDLDRSLWMRTLAIVAYGRAGGNWSVRKTRREAEENLGEQWGEYVDEAENWLMEIGLIDEEDRELVPA